MQDIRTPFYAFRYLVVLEGNQTSILNPAGISKEELAKNIFVELLTNSKTEWNYNRKRFVFYGIQSFDDRFFILKFVKETQESTLQEGETDVEKLIIPAVKFVYVFVDTLNQIIFIERNTSVFTNVSTCADKISKYMKEKLYDYHFSVNIYPLPSIDRFWSIVERSEKIFSLEITVSAPNMWHGGDEMRSLLQDLKNQVNNDEATFSVKSERGTLTLLQSSLKSMLDYILEVGGKYKLKITRANSEKKETINSKDNITRFQFQKHQSALYSDQELLELKAKSDLIHDAETRGQAEDNEPNDLNES